jgi:integrase
MTDRLHAKITKSAVDRLAPGQVLRDIEFKGFGVRRQQGAPSYFLQKKIHGRVRWFTIGPHGLPWTPETARREASRLLRAVAEGVDPTEQKRFEREKPTFAEAAPMFMADHGPRLKARTREEYDKLFRNYLVPAFGSRHIADITKPEVSRFHSGMAGIPAAANFALSVMSRLMRWSEEQSFRPSQSNPCHGVKKFRPAKRERFLSQVEFARLGDILDRVQASNSQNLFAVAAIRLLILTGARHSEIITLKWSYVDLERGLLLLPDSKTGQKSIRLSAAAVGILRHLPHVQGNPYVIVGKRHGTCLVNLQKPWDEIRKLAGLPEVRIHDLRHSFASVAAANGASLPMIGKLLGHANTQTTARYSHLADNPLHKLNEEVGASIGAAMAAKP